MSSIKIEYEKYGIKKEEVLEWGRKNYPELANNEFAIYVLYLRKVKGISVLKKRGISETGEVRKVKIKDLFPGEVLETEGTVIELIRDRSYEGCPECFRKVVDGRCPSGHEVKPEKIRWLEYAFADDTGYTILVIPPKTDANIEIDGRYIVRGVYNGKDSITARMVMKVEGKAVESETEEMIKGLLMVMEGETIEEFMAYAKKRGVNVGEKELLQVLKKYGYDVMNGVVKKVEK
jgi:hypothetical protein